LLCLTGVSGLSGWDLQALLHAAASRGETLTSALVAHIGIEACRGLARLHRRGMVHGDVSPATLVLSWGGEVKLGENGAGPLAWYLAPEQARHEPLDARTDLYSLGLVLYEALMGRRARRGDNVASIGQAFRGERVRLDGPLAAAILRATQPDRQDRFFDADAMRGALEHELAQLPRSGRDLASELSLLLRDWGLLGSDQQLPGVAAEPTTFTSLAGEERPWRATIAAALLGSAVGLALVVALLVAGLAPTKADARRRPATIGCAVRGVQAECATCPNGDGLYRGSSLNDATEGITLPDDETYRCTGGVITPE
jgi:serine/threonine protein kinase